MAMDFMQKMRRTMANVPKVDPAAPGLAGTQGPQGTYAGYEAIRPDYQSVLNDQGVLADQYQIDPGQISYGEGSAADAYSKQATTAAEDSAWYKMATDKIAADKTAGLDAASKGAAGAAAEARSALAMRGGLGSGAAERLARGSARDKLMAQQDIHRQAQGLGMDAAMQAEQNRLAALPGAAQLDYTTQAQNIANQMGAQEFASRAAMGDIGAQNAFDMAKFQEQMKVEASNRLANSTAGGGASGGSPWSGMAGQVGDLMTPKITGNQIVDAAINPIGTMNKKLTGMFGD